MYYQLVIQSVKSLAIRTMKKQFESEDAAMDYFFSHKISENNQLVSITKTEVANEIPTENDIIEKIVDSYVEKWDEVTCYAAEKNDEFIHWEIGAPFDSFSIDLDLGERQLYISRQWSSHSISLERLFMVLESYHLAEQLQYQS